MPGNINDLMAEQLGRIDVTAPWLGEDRAAGLAPQSVSDRKKASVIATSSAKKGKLGGYESGAGQDVGLRDTRISPEMMAIGGAPDVMENQAWIQGRENYMKDASGWRTGRESSVDAGVSTINSVIQSALAMGGLGAGVVDKVAGTDSAAFFDEASEIYNDSAAASSSDVLAQHKVAKAARDRLTQDFNKELEIKEIEDGSSPLMAGLRRVGRDAKRELFGNSNDILDQDVLTTGLGSLAVAGPLGKAARAMKLGRASMPAAIGLLEGGGAYQQTASEIRNMTSQQLRQTSPDFVRMVDVEGLDEDVAKARLANDAGLIASAIQAPVGAATGMLVSKFEANPLARQTIRSMVANILREGTEETAQSISGGLASNYAIGETADVNRELAEGLGMGAAQGLKAGVGTAAIIQAPGVGPAIGRAAMHGIIRPAAEKVVERAKGIRDSLGADSPTSTLNMSANVEAIHQKFGVPEFREAVKATLGARVGAAQEVENVQGETIEVTAKSMGDYVDRIHDRMSIDGAAEAELESSPVVKDAVGQSVNRFDAMSRVSAIITDENSTPEDKRDAGIYLLDQLKKNTELFDSDVAQAIALAPDDETDTTLQELRSYEEILGQLVSNPEIKAALQQANDIASGITVEQVEDPEAAVAAARYAEVAPETAKLDVINRVLLHAEQGTAPIPETSRQSLEATRAVLEAEAEHTADNAAIKASGEKIQSNPNIVSQSVKRRGDDRENGMLSGRDYQTRILSAWRAGDKVEAGKQLGNLRKFAQHLGNKVTALNESVAKGNGIAKDSSVKYQSLNNRTKKFGQSMKGLYVNPEIANHVAFAQQVESDAKAITNLSNKFAGIFAELGIEPIEMVSLAPELKGNATKVAAKFQAEKWGETRRQGKPAPYAKPTTGPVDKSVDKTPESPAANAAPGTREVEEAPEAESEATAEAKPQTRSERIKEVSAKLQDTAKGKLQTIEAYPPELATKMDEGLHRFAFRSEEGRLVTGKYVIEGDLISDLDVGDKANPVKLGGPGTREMFRQILAAHPGVKTIQAFRTSGARSADEQIWFALQADGTIKNSKTDPRIDGTAEVAGATEAKVEEKPVAAEPKSDPEPAPAPAEPVQIDKAVEPISEPKPAPEPTVDTSTVKSFFNKLFTDAGRITNYFLESYVFRTDSSRLVGDLNPVQTIANALKSQAAWVAMAGTNAVGELTPELAKGYAKYLGDRGSKVKSTLTERLAAGLVKKRGDSTFAQMMTDADLKGRPPTTFNNGKVLNLVERNKDGSFTYNQQLLDGAVLAGLQWALTANDRTSYRDRKQVARLLGIAEDLVEQKDITFFNTGVPTIFAKRQLRDQIKKFWGVKAAAGARQGYVDGIAEAMAAEIMHGLEAAGLFEQTAPTKINDRDYIQLVFSEAPDVAALQELPTAIEQAVLTKPAAVFRFTTEDANRPTNQLRNKQARLTRDQKTMVERESKIPHKINTPMVELYEALGDAFVLVFGGGVIDESTTNSTHAESLKGQNQTVLGAQKTLNNLLAQARNVNPDLDAIEIFYDYEISAVGRLQQQGSNNPQSSKVMREAILSTIQTVDLTDPAMLTLFKLAMAQHWDLSSPGKKPDQATHDVIAADVDTIASGETFAPMLEMLAKWEKKKAPFTAADVDLIKVALGDSETGQVTPAALHAALEFARYQNATADERKAFKTSAYIEADGKTDGPINAMMHMVSGNFSENWISMMEKGGFFVGARSLLEAGTPMTLNNFVSLGGDRAVDLYGTAAEITSAHLLETGKRTNSVAQQHMRHMVRLMQELGVGLKITSDGQSIEISRKLVKNPITITIYGSGERGIAGNIVSAMFDEIYARLSKGDALSAGGLEAFKTLSETGVAYDKQGRAYLKTFDKGKNFYPSDTSNQGLEFSRAQKKNLTDNVLKLFVQGPLKSGIDATTGETSGNVAIMRQAIQVQSIFLARQFNEKVHAKLAQLDSATDGLTNEEIMEIWDSLKHLNPMIDTGFQTYNVAATGKADLRNLAKIQEDQAHNRRVIEVARVTGKEVNPDDLRKPSNPVDFGRSLDDKFRTPSEMEAPTNAGVRGIPMMIIGPGDGLMIQIFSNDPSRPNSLLVFDGINMGLNDFKAGSEAANRAVAGGWFDGNPLGDVATSFNNFFAEIDLSNIDEPLRAELNDAIIGLNSDLVPVAELIAEMKKLGPDLEQAALGIQARKNVLKNVGWSIDHMAAGMAPHSQTGTVALEGNTPVEIAASLNKLLAVEIERLQADSSVERPVKQDISSKLNLIGELNEASGARTTGLNELRGAVRKMAIPKDQKRLLEATLRALGSSDLQVTFGTLEQIVADRASKNLEALDLSGVDADTKVNGMHIGEENQVYLISPSSETLTHELIHAATLGHLDSYYSNDKVGLTPTQIDAIERLEAMMQQMLTINDNEIDASARKAYYNMRSEVIRLLEVDPAAALNEFMAWSLANRDLISAGKQIKTNFFAKLASDVIAAIKDLIWGRAKGPEVGEDLYSNIRFNTLVLMNSNPSIEKRVGRSIQFHRSDPVNNMTRMDQVHEGLMQRIASFVDSFPAVERPRQISRLDTAIDISEEVSRTFTDNGFAMDPQRTQVFQTLVMALATEAELDGNALSRMQQLYAGITRQLTQQDFMVDPINGGFADLDQAQKKLNALLGVYATRADLKGRSTLLPSFLALAVTNEQFRNVLRKIELPKSLKNDDKTVDAVLENFGTDRMDDLMRLTSGEGRGNVNVLTAIDALTDRMSKMLTTEEGLIQQGWTKGGTIVDLLNDKVNEGLKVIADRSAQVLGSVAANSNNKAVKIGANVLQAITSLASEERTAITAEGINSALNNNSVIPSFLKEVYVEVVGRTQSNALIYDMIKKVRSYVQQTRQEFREQLPKTLAKMFSRPLTDEEYSSLTKGLAKTDIAVLIAGIGVEETMSLLTSPTAVNSQIARLEAEIQALDPAQWALRQTKAKELAEFMNGGEAGRNLLRNAHAVSNLYLEIPNGIRLKGVPVDANMIDKMDQLITLYALKGLDQSTIDGMKLLIETEADGMNATISYLIGQRKDEMAKVAGSDRAIVNHYKGHVPFENDAGSQLIVADDADAPKLEALGFKRVADYKGSRSERSQVSRGYYYTPVRGRAAFKQGIMQNVRKSAYGVDPYTGYTMDSTVAGVIENPNEIAQINRLLRVNGANGGEALLPVMNLSGDVVAYERSIRPSEHARLKINDHLGEVLGIWRGRLAEEHYAEGFNRSLVQNLATTWNAEKSSKASEYIDLLGPEAARDPVFKDAVSLLTRDSREMIKQSFPDGRFMVRKDLVNDAVGYRNVSIGDSWTGISRMNPEMQRLIRDVSMSILGKDAFRKLITAEAGLQRFVTDAKVTIVVKSIVVPAFNIMSNIVQLSARGVPLTKIGKGFGQKAAEVDAFLKGRLERQRLEVLERIAKANNDMQGLQQHQSEIRAILDANRRLSIWPLIEAGELSSISDTGLSHEDVLLSEGRMAEYFDQLTDRLPNNAKTVAKYGMITRDTALFAGLQKSVEYGDFLAKAVLYDHLTINRKHTKEDALARVGQEFVNYDRNAGRQRGYLEDIGVLWFWNFKLRSIKVASSTLRNNPVHAALTMLMPLPTGIGSPLTDNALSVVTGGNVGYSVGWDQLLHAHSLNPFWNMAT